jgi:hypothetical protein
VKLAANAYASQTVIYVTNLNTKVQYATSGPRYGTQEISYTVPAGLVAGNAYEIKAVAWTSYGIFTRVINVVATSSATRLAFAPAQEQKAAKGAVRATPNPFSESTRLNLSGHAGPVMVSIMDVRGSLVERIVGDNPNTLEVGKNLKPGMYIIVVDVPGTDKQTMKIIKQ